MPKMKSHRGAAKRFKKTGTGKITRARSGRRHILTKKSPKRKRQMRRRVVVTGGDARRLRVLLPD